MEWLYWGNYYEPNNKTLLYRVNKNVCERVILEGLLKYSYNDIIESVDGCILFKPEFVKKLFLENENKAEIIVSNNINE
jgi:hypothetical protein